ncbi:hypothetical protein JW851_02985 [Candidatus Woesearchaeota archaeon]|nr:hypothetical protein [Candidatus Woesearchaeota archaeon]
MKYAILFAFILLLVIFLGSLWGDSIKSYVVKDVLGQDICEINGVMCKCYSRECVCGNKIVPKQECLNRVLA